MMLLNLLMEEMGPRRRGFRCRVCTKSRQHHNDCIVAYGTTCRDGLGSSRRFASRKPRSQVRVKFLFYDLGTATSPGLVAPFKGVRQ